MFHDIIIIHREPLRITDQVRFGLVTDNSVLSLSASWILTKSSSLGMESFTLLLHVLQVKRPGLQLNVTNVVLVGPLQSSSNGPMLDCPSRCCSTSAARTMKFSIASK